MITRQMTMVIIVLIIGYLIGARFPGIAKRVGFA